MRRTQRGRLFYAWVVGILYATILPHYGWGQSQTAVSPRVEESKSSAGNTRPRRTALLTKVRHVSSENSTRVIMELTAEIRHEVHMLPEDAARGLPTRVYIDIFGASLGSSPYPPTIVEDKLIRQIRVGQFSSEIVRVVFDMKGPHRYQAYVMPDPYRLVMDVETQDETVALSSANSRPREAKKAPPVANAIGKIVLDPGHGGKDTGAIGAGGVMEKDIVLAVAKKLAKKLEQELGVQVVLTRENDTFIALEDRTAIANAENADLFISLHVNASADYRVRGIETYYLDNTDDEAAIRLAARENSTSRRNVSDIQFILSDLIQNSKLEDSIALAHHIQSSLVSQLGRQNGGVKNLGVKKAPFYVLVQAKMPSVLAEIFFISNKAEERQLTSESYQDAIVDALYRGIKRYRDSSAPVKSL